MTVQDCFQAAARVETLLRDLYLGLARCFRGQPPVAAAFRSLASGVEQHALRIRLLALHRGSADRNDDTLERVSADVVTMLVELSAMAVNALHDPDGDSALRVLRRVGDAERRCHAIHAEVIRRSNDPVVLGLFSALAMRDADHEQLLRRVERASKRATAPSSTRRSAHARAWAGGGSFAVARQVHSRRRESERVGSATAERLPTGWQMAAP
jgi:hypothetical protein